MDNTLYVGFNVFLGHWVINMAEKVTRAVSEFGWMNTPEGVVAL